MEKQSSEECEELEEDLRDVKVMVRDVDNFQKSLRFKKEIKAIENQVKEACEDEN